MHKILLVEDIKLFGNKLVNYSQWELRLFGEDFMEVLSLFVQLEPYLLLMDIGLPLFNGYHWCQEFWVSTYHVSVFESGYGYCHGVNMGADDL